MPDEPLTRPIPDAMNEIRQAAAKVSAVLDDFYRAGEVTVRIDLFGAKDVLTLHIPFPKGDRP